MYTVAGVYTMAPQAHGAQVELGSSNIPIQVRGEQPISRQHTASAPPAAPQYAVPSQVRGVPPGLGLLTAQVLVEQAIGRQQAFSAQPTAPMYVMPPQAHGAQGFVSQHTMVPPARSAVEPPMPNLWAMAQRDAHDRTTRKSFACLST